jgi:hypothetical protein
VLWFGILAGPVAWMTHLALEYFLVTLHCQLNGGDVEVYMAASTTALLALCAAGGFAGYLSWRRLSGPDVNNWARFMAASGMVLSVLFLIGIILGTVPVYALEVCNDVH